MSGPAKEIGPGLRLAGFFAALVVVFGAGLGLGALIGPDGEPPAPTHAPGTPGHP